MPQTQQYAGGDEDEAVSGNWGRLVPLVKDCREIELLNSKAEVERDEGCADLVVCCVLLTSGPSPPPFATPPVHTRTRSCM